MSWPCCLYRLRDPLDRWIGEDKGVHVLAGAVLWLLVGGRWGLFLGAAIGWELLEAVRWMRWQVKGAPSPWPWATDKASLKDLLADVVGIGLALLIAPACATAQGARTAPAVVLPDSLATPGERRPMATRPQLCDSGSTQRYRGTITAAVRDSVLARYPQPAAPGVCCQWDHLIPIALGGITSARNLWRQPYLPVPGALEKDRLEVWLWEQVCRGRLPLPAAQRAIATNWYGVYLSWQADSAPHIGAGGPVHP